jgi:predicted NUDIX family NTP pyrophosphohydrolase
MARRPQCGTGIGNSTLITLDHGTLATVMKHSSGTLLYRSTPAGVEVLLIHASGPYNRDKPWSIPKGLPDEGEALEAAARRETREETGVEAGDLVYLGHIDYRKSRKRVHCYAGAVREAQPRPASWEVDQACFLPLDEARQKLHPDQLPFLDRLEEHLRSAPSSS